MLSEQTWQHIRSVITELDGGCVDDTWHEYEGWLIYGHRSLCSQPGGLPCQLTTDMNQLGCLDRGSKTAETTWASGKVK
jgi:hypothetical protein